MKQVTEACLNIRVHLFFKKQNKKKPAEVANYMTLEMCFIRILISRNLNPSLKRKNLCAIGTAFFSVFCFLQEWLPMKLQV